MRAVVTGANGFAGRWLCGALVSQGATVFGWVRSAPTNPIPEVRYRVQDVRDREGCRAAMKEDSPDSVFHLAAITHLGECEREPATAYAVNVEGARNVFLSMPKAARGVFSSTCHIYGHPQMDRIGEAHPASPKGVYAETKYEAEQEIERLARNVVIARAFHHTGPGQSTRYVLADWAAQMRAGRSTVQVGDLDLRRDFSDVRDIVQGYLHLAKPGVEPTVYNLCSGIAHTLGELFDFLRDGRACEAVRDPSRIRPLDVAVFCGDPRRARSVGIEPGRPIQRTLKEMF